MHLYCRKIRKWHEKLTKWERPQKIVPSLLGAILVSPSHSLWLTVLAIEEINKERKLIFYSWFLCLFFFFHWEFETLHQIYETLSSLTSRETKSFLLKKKKKNNNMFPWSLFRITLCEVMLGKRYFHCWIESLSRERCLFTVVSAFFVITILVLVKIEKFYQGGR